MVVQYPQSRLTQQRLDFQPSASLAVFAGQPGLVGSLESRLCVHSKRPFAGSGKRIEATATAAPECPDLSHQEGEGHS